jgi:hypothetical protein
LKKSIKSFLTHSLIIATTVIKHNHLIALKVGKSKALSKAVHVCTKRKHSSFWVREKGKD